MNKEILATEKPERIISITRKIRPNFFPDTFCGRNFHAKSDRLLGGITKFSSGNTPSKNKAEFWDGDIPWISASAMHDSRIDSSSYHITTEAVQNGAQIAPQGTILLLVRGSMLHKRIPIGIASREVAFNQDVKSLSIRHDITNTFLLFSLISKERRLLNSVTKTGIGAGKLDTNELKALEVEIPNKKEQQKIADCLSSVDALIGLQGRKVEQLARHKQALLQQLFPADGDDCMDAGGRATQDAKAETTPRLRFPEYRTAPAWEDKRLANLITTISPPKKLLTESYQDSGKYPIIDQSQAAVCGWTDDKDALVEIDCPLIIFGDHTCILKFMGQPFAQGADGIKIIKSKKEIDSKYLYYFIQHDPVEQKGYRRHFSTLKEKSVVYPDKDSGEQQKIANCLSSLDTLIDLHRRKLEALKRHKQGLMQQLFPAEEEV